MRPRTQKKPAVKLAIGTIAAASLALPVIVVAQNGVGPVAPSTPPAASGSLKYDPNTLHFASNLGSFKLLRKGPKNPPRGKLVISFKGSLLVSGIEGNGTLTPSGNIRREYFDAKHNKQVWFGQGKLVVDGTMHNVEWFGSNMTGAFTGDGVFRLMGEFDDQKKTGEFWYDPADKRPWLPSGSEVAVPRNPIQFQPPSNIPPPSTPVRAAGG